MATSAAFCSFNLKLLVLAFKTLVVSPQKPKRGPLFLSHYTTDTGSTYTGCQDAGSSLVKVESPDTSHAVGYEGQHVAVRQQPSVKNHKLPPLFTCIVVESAMTHISPPFKEMTILS